MEQIIRPKRSRQVSLRELLRGQVGAPKGEPPEPAGCSAQAKKEPIQTEDDDQFDVPVNVSDQAPQHQAIEMMEGQKVNTEEGLSTRSPPSVDEYSKRSQVSTTPSTGKTVIKESPAQKQTNQQVMISNKLDEMM